MCSGGCGKCKIGRGSPIVRAATHTSYRRGNCRNHGIPPFATVRGCCLLPYGGAGSSPDSFLALDVCNNAEANGAHVSLWEMTDSICSGIKRKEWHKYMPEKGISHEQVTKNIEVHVDKESDESWAEWGARQIEGGG